MIEAGDLDVALSNLEGYCSDMTQCMTRVSSVYEAGFASSLSSYGIIFDHFPPAVEQTSLITDKIGEAASLIRPRAKDLNDLLLSLKTTDHVIDILQRVEELVGLPERVAELVEAKRWLAAAKMVQSGVDQLLSDDMLGIRALEVLRKRMLDLKNLLPEMILSELRSFVYLYSLQMSKVEIQRRMEALNEGSLLREPLVDLRASGNIETVASNETLSPKQDRMAAGSGVVAAAKKRMGHRRGKSISSAAEVLDAKPKLQHRDSVEIAVTIDHRHDFPRYIRSLIGALSFMDKATSSLNELSNGSDAAHRRVVDLEFKREEEEEEENNEDVLVFDEPSSSSKSVTVRHRDCLVQIKAVEATARVLSRVVTRACSRLTLVLHHHLVVAKAVGTKTVGARGQVSKYTARRQWRSIQKALIGVLERFLLDDKSALLTSVKMQKHYGDSSLGAESAAEDSSSSSTILSSNSTPHTSQIEGDAEDHHPPQLSRAGSSFAFRFSASSAAYVFSEKDQKQQREDIAALRTLDFHNVSTGDFSFVLSPGAVEHVTPHSTALRPSPYCLPTLLPQLREFDARAHALVVSLGASSLSPSQHSGDEGVDSDSEGLLGEWLDRFVRSVYLPRLRQDYTRVLSRLTGLLQDTKGAASLVVRAVKHLAADARQSSDGGSLFGELARDLVLQLMTYVEQRLLAITLHTETFRRIKGTSILEVLEGDPSIRENATARDIQVFNRDFKGIERRYLLGSKPVEADDLIKDATDLAAIALLTDAVRCVRDSLSKAVEDEFTSSAKEDMMDACQNMYLNCAASLKLELRHQCYHYLAQINELAYTGLPGQDPDPCVRNLAAVLATFQEVLPADPFVTSGLSTLIADALVYAVTRFNEIDSAGARKMQLNIITLQHRLAGSLFREERDDRVLDAASAYYGLVDSSMEQLVRSINDSVHSASSSHVFTLEEYMSLLSKRVPSAPSEDVNEKQVRESLEKALAGGKR